MTRPDDEKKSNEPQEKFDWSPHSFSDDCPPTDAWEILHGIPYEGVRLHLLNFLGQNSASEPLKGTFDPAEYRPWTVLRLTREVQISEFGIEHTPTSTVFWGTITEGVNSYGLRHPVLAFFGEDSLKTERPGIMLLQRTNPIIIAQSEHIRNLPAIEILNKYTHIHLYERGKK
jgi:hypothetical protein